MTLSVIIVNYNVKYFLEQCLHSVLKAASEIETEVIVVDNHSTDESIPYLAPKFPEVTFIRSKANAGFAKACNRGLEEASGNYILFLNPDTLVAEDSFETCIQFFNTHPDCGALGVKMIDGSGAFLKESKRAFPSPLTSLFKLFGFSRLFPRSRLFSRYHLGHLDKDKNHEVDVLAGAYLMVRHSVLKEIGSFDEAFFMYGEDVDLSYRIQKGGYKNYYLADTSIIHFKGESTKRGSLNYVRMFYYAMSVFVKKHYGGVKAGVFHFSIQVAIWIRALIAALTKALSFIGIPAIDAVFILLSFWLVKEAWSALVRTDTVYPDKLLLVSFPAFTLVYLTAAYYAGLYDRYYKLSKLVRSTLTATVTLLAIYALLPESLRFSRAIVLLGALLAFLLIMAERFLLVRAGLLQQPPDASTKPHILIAASAGEYNTVQSFLQKRGFGERIIGRVGTNGGSENMIAHVDNLDAIAKTLLAKELILCAGSLSYKKIISLTDNLRGGLKFRYHALGSCSIVGSDTSTSSGEILSTETSFAIANASNRRLKRLIDTVTAIAFLLSFPLQLFLVNKPLGFLRNCFSVLAGKRTWVGYSKPSATLPLLRSGVLAPNGRKQPAHTTTTENRQLLDYWYARNYEPLQDIKTIFRHYAHLGTEGVT
ncbi:glycosyltransferase [Flavisolibacter sp. BT320]|nr:glycosyltransferase [Flavisolibacter longurius]